MTGTNVTRLADIVNPAIFYPYFSEFSVKTSALINSGILARSAEYDMMAGSKGSAVTVPFLRPYSGRALPWRADGNNAPDSLSQASAQMQVPFFRRRAKFGWNNLALAIAGIRDTFVMGRASWGYNAIAKPGDASATLAHYIADFWNEDLQQTVIAMLNGVFASTTNVAGFTEQSGITSNAGLADLVLDATLSPAQVTAGAAIGVANRISPITIGGAQSLLSDRGDNLTCIAMHPQCYWQNILPNNITPNLQTTDQAWQIPKYLDLDVILDDTLPVDRANPLYPQYTSYLFAKGSIMFGDYSLAESGEGAELDRDVDNAEDFLTTRRKYLVQVGGTSYVGTSFGAAGEGPSDTNLSTAANWSRADAVKNIGVVKLVTNR